MVSGGGSTTDSPGPRPVQSDVFVALGANLGDREDTLRAALHDLEAQGDIRVVRCSSLHETDPVGGPPAQPRYLNAVAELETTLSPTELLERLLEIERRHGRTRSVSNGPRTLDLDLLLYGDRRIDDPELTVPHPRMWERIFVTGPLAELRDVAQLRSRFLGETHVR